MVPAIELVRGLELQREKNLVKTPEIEPATALVFAQGIAQGIAQSNQLVLSSQPSAFSAMADFPTWSNTVLSAALVAWTALEVDLASTVKALEQNLEVAPFAAPFCGSKEMTIWLLSFVPSRATNFGRRC